ncbi:DUF5666 domain-containing protein [Aquabacterium sp.]|uniref:DUF5666 domain-containing protein n=1 Tax=Aquabacterium sp. TaxID=1872578 RepID=UPI0025BCF5CF|nr:DUF5666 domain-containing protein [Aquabacterium sp.]
MNAFPQHLSRASLAVALSSLGLALVACGGGGGGSTSATTSSSGTATAASYSGTVSGLGSIVVNGVRFSTTGATTVDGDDPRLSHSSAFTLGSTVTVSGTVDDSTSTGQASTVTVHGGVRGSVSAVDTTAQTLTVSGQTIQVDANTVFEGLNGATFNLTVIQTLLAASTPVYVEVYGVADANNVILASRIERKSALASGYAVLGTVAALDTTAKTFSLTLRSGTVVTVDYSAGELLPTGVTLANGAVVRVRSATNPDTLASGATLSASKVIVKVQKQSVGAAKLRGAVTAISGTTWSIGDVSVDVSQSPVLEGFTALSDVVVGTVVKVKGNYVNSVLVATKVESEGYESRDNAGGVKLYGVVSNATAASGSSLATFDVQGVTVSIASGSSLALPANASYVEVRAALVNGVLTATSISSSSNASTKAFEVYGTVPCPNGSSDLSTTFTLTLRNGSTSSVNGSAATIKAERGVSLSSVVANASCLVEVKGTTGGSSAITASVIEVKSRN